MTSFFSKIEPYISQDKIEQKIQDLGQKIAQDYAGQELICVCILKGSIIFFSDLIRAIDDDIRIDFMRISSYGNDLESSGVVQILQDLSFDIRDKHVLIVEDIVDTGNTLSALLETLRLRNPASIKLCSLLSKPSRRKKDVNIDYLGFTIDDHFVVGYGLDAAEQYRNLPFIGKLNL
ncbi:MAG TPA: hypoxanthine phosphoribosyltransferase [Oligoflexia bacterium]|nr:hypoxanthine phosphoribosyltransferase [Oligoflexia bacterium]HMR25446.1 hypoxanthine phosphoribosyltransferase [Oligoflexia bacterium]